VATYNVKQNVDSVQVGDPLGTGTIERSYSKGPVSPKSEQDEVALEHLVALGLATVKRTKDEEE
jgi:hypothetical protein